MNHRMMGRLVRLALAASLVAVVAQATWADPPTASGETYLVDPFVAYDMQFSPAIYPQETSVTAPPATAIAAEMSQSKTPAIETAMLYPASVTPAGCAEPSCDCPAVDCGDGCTTCCQPDRYYYAGTEVTFLIPDFDNNGFTTFRLEDNNDPVRDVLLTNDATELDDMEFGPRVWVGVQRGCWGVVGRFWHMDASDTAGAPFLATENQEIGFGLSSDFEAYTIDLEATRTICLRGTQHVVSFGVRYGSVENNSQLTTISDTVDSVFTSSSRTSQAAHGTGITTSLSGSKVIGCSCVKAFYNVRGSLLWGPTETFAETRVVADGAFATNGAATRVDDELFISEVQFGLQIDRRLVCVPADAFVRVAAEYQYWNADTGLSTATSFAGFGLGPDSLGTATATASGVEMSLYGFSVATGVAW